MPRIKRVSYLSVLMVILLSGTACSPTSETVTTTAQSEIEAASAESSLTLLVEPSSSLPNTGQESTDPGPTYLVPSNQEPTEIERYIYEHPNFMLTNSSDLSTPLGTLCWAVWELARMNYLRLIDILAENTPGLEVSYSDVNSIIGEEDNTIGSLGLIGSVGVVDEETARGTNAYTYLHALEEIQKPGVVGIVNDSKLSEELQLFAQAFCELIAAIESQVRALGYENIDYTKLPYKDLDSLPHIDVLEKAAVAHPDACVFPSERDVEEWDDNWDAQNGVTD